MASTSDFAVNPVLTQGAVGDASSEQEWIYDKIPAVLNVNASTGRTMVKEQYAGRATAAGGDASTSSQGELYEIGNRGQRHPVSYDYTSATYSTIEHGVFDMVTDRMIRDAAAAGVDLKRNTSADLMSSLFVAREIVLAGLLNDSSGFTSATPTNHWGHASSALVSDMNTAKKTIRQAVGKSGKMLTLVCGGVVMEALRSNVEVANWQDKQNRAEDWDGSEDGLAKVLASFLGLKAVLFGMTVKNSAAAGVAGSGADIWGDFANLIWLRPGEQTPDAGVVDYVAMPPSIGEARNPTDRGPTLTADDEHVLKVHRYDYGYHFVSPGS